jgi:hypothetical protein
MYKASVYFCNKMVGSCCDFIATASSLLRATAGRPEVKPQMWLITRKPWKTQQFDICVFCICLAFEKTFKILQKSCFYVFSMKSCFNFEWKVIENETKLIFLASFSIITWVSLSWVSCDASHLWMKTHILMQCLSLCLMMKVPWTWWQRD